MKPEELRMGNYVEIDCHDWVIGKILTIYGPFYTDELGVNYEDESGDLDFAEMEDIYSIPLTEQWLKDFGNREIFENIFQLQLDEDTVLIINLDCNTFGIHQHTAPSENVEITKHDMTVHWYQNLYFALTGKELKL